MLVVDDEPQILRVLRHGLEGQGFEVATAPDAESALRLFQNNGIEMIITDLRMPGLDGVGFCQKVRKGSSVPILVLTVKGDEATKVQALDAGADDYVTKPFGMDELLARVRALLRRATPSSGTQQPVLQAGDFRLDPDQRHVSVAGKELHLTPKEYDLLAFLMQNHGRVLTHRAILSAVWGENSAEQPEYLRVFVAQLRKKIEADPRHPRYLRTEPWIGYRFDPAA